MELDLWALYRHMLWSRTFEEAVAELWQAGRISGEMHLGLGEEAVVAGVVLQLGGEDAMALDHRGTPPLLMRGVDPVLLLREFLGRPDGLCGGKGGHMHLFSPRYLAASSGIVGAGGPAAAGFGLAALHLRPGSVAVTFFGEGAMNQGMMLESINLAVVWNLPVLFVCKDNGWAISTRSSSTTGGKVIERVQGMGMPAAEVDGSDVEAVWHAARPALERARQGKGPSFLQAYCTHLEGHLMGDRLLRITRGELEAGTGSLVRSLLRFRGGSLGQRLRGMWTILTTMRRSGRDHDRRARDPLAVTRPRLEGNPILLERLEREVQERVEDVVERALQPVGEGGVA